jgi:hypothetical protein
LGDLSVDEGKIKLISVKQGEEVWNDLSRAAVDFNREIL